MQNLYSMYRYYLLLLLALFLATGCRTMKLRDLDTSLRSDRRLPALEPEWKPAGLESLHFSEWDTLASIHDRHPYGTVGYAPPYYPLVPSLGGQDARMLFEREVTRSLTDPYTPKVGYITCRVPNAIARPRHVGLTYLSLGLLGLPALLGVPMGNYQTELLLEVQVLDKNRNLVAQYSATGRSRIPVAFYWGYRTDDAKRLANIRAFKAALAAIHQQLQSDYDRINTRLANP